MADIYITLIALAYICLNILTFIMMGLDKQRARKREWRIPERAIWLLSIIGGSVGTFIAMRVFRHKTKHLSFTLGVPLLIFMQLSLIIYGWLS